MFTIIDESSAFLSVCLSNMLYEYLQNGGPRNSFKNKNNCLL
jgi:hypothetical protein